MPLVPRPFISNQTHYGTAGSASVEANNVSVLARAARWKRRVRGGGGVEGAFPHLAKNSETGRHSRALIAVQTSVPELPADGSVSVGGHPSRLVHESPLLRWFVGEQTLAAAATILRAELAFCLENGSDHEKGQKLTVSSLPPSHGKSAHCGKCWPPRRLKRNIRLQLTNDLLIET